MMRFAEIGLGIAIVNDFCSPPRGTVRRRTRAEEFRTSVTGTDE